MLTQWSLQGWKIQLGSPIPGSYNTVTIKAHWSEEHFYIISHKYIHMPSIPLRGQLVRDQGSGLQQVLTTVKGRIRNAEETSEQCETSSQSAGSSVLWATKAQGESPPSSPSPNWKQVPGKTFQTSAVNQKIKLWAFHGNQPSRDILLAKCCGSPSEAG